VLAAHAILRDQLGKQALRMDAAEAWVAFVAFDEGSKETPEEDIVELRDKAQTLSFELHRRARVLHT
jgi:hypothetical protein